MYCILGIIILIVAYRILTMNGTLVTGSPGSSKNSGGTGGMGKSLGSTTSPDLRLPTPQGGSSKLYTPFSRRRLGVTNF